MNAVRLHRGKDTLDTYSVKNPAPAARLVLDSNVLIPQPCANGDILVQIKASSVVRDALTWPESYSEAYKILGNDFSGVVIGTYGKHADSNFDIGDEVYGMTHADRCGTWAEYMVVQEREICLKPRNLSWAEAAAAPLSALTAYQALFEKAELTRPNLWEVNHYSVIQEAHAIAKQSILITGASGAVGTYLVQFAKLAGLRVTAATRSVDRNKAALEKLGADEVVDYNNMTERKESFGIIADTVGGDVLRSCWSPIAADGIMISVHSAEFNFVEEHQNLGIACQKSDVKAIWFVVQPSRAHLQDISVALEKQLIQYSLVETMPLASVSLAYEKCSSADVSNGKIVLLV